MIWWENIKRQWLLGLILVATIGWMALMNPDTCHAICATVKIEIRQELTLERQAFDAHMRINNGLTHISLEDVSVTVNFTDEDGEPMTGTSDPDNTSAQFFIRVDSMENIEDVTGSGSVSPETSADIHWLIIPAPGASNGLESGKLYFVGATLTYSAGGEAETVEVTPDYIFVKPMPQLILDYFLPTDVYGDDPSTSSVEAAIPFFMGLRISNKGYGTAYALKVESAQPKIVDNEMGLIVGFQIDGTQVNGQVATNSLLADFGDISPNTCAVASWIMSATLSGKFTDFTADFSHSDELGGKLTSLIGEDDIHTHFLLQTVLVDAAGRDTVEDFLSKNDGVVRVYESDNLDADVLDQSSSSNLQSLGGSEYLLTTPPTDGFFYVQLNDPSSGNLVVKEIIRSDGKRIKSANAWLSKTREGDGPWQYFFNLFDYNSPGRYSIAFENPANMPQPPVLISIPERITIEGQQVSFIVEASDPNGTTPSLSVERLPLGAFFSDEGNGMGIFDWTPAVGQAGRYSIKFIAGDGTLASSRQGIIIVRSENDTDGDGMPDAWELARFGTLDRDGHGDFDGDGIADLDEYLNGLDPLVSESVPGIPEIISPATGAHVPSTTPELVFAESIDPEGDPVTYVIEIFSDRQYTDLIASDSIASSGSDTITWQNVDPFPDNTTYYWRISAMDNTGSSLWRYGHFFIDLANEPPTAPTISYPVDGTTVAGLTPTLQIGNSADPDGDIVSYVFEIYADSSLTELLQSSSEIISADSGFTSWTVEAPLEDGYWYYWRVVASDTNLAETEGPSAAFLINATYAVPSAPIIVSPSENSEISAQYATLLVENTNTDQLPYDFELDRRPEFCGTGKLSSGSVLSIEDNAGWDVDDLEDNTRYYWRVKAGDGLADSLWAVGTFFVNTINNAPTTPALKNPAYDAWVNTTTPQLSVHPATDADEDILYYRFEIYSDADLTRPVTYTETETPQWDSVSPLDPGQWYYWRAQAVDEHGLPSIWTPVAPFFVKINSVDIAPQLTFIDPAENLTTNAQGIILRWADVDPDSNADIAFYFDTDNTGEDGTLIAAGISEDPDGTDDYLTWDISSLEGNYYIYAVISDGVSTETVYCSSLITIDHTPPAVDADPVGGIYPGPIDVTLTTNEDAVIYYTLDNSEPDFNSDLYNAPIHIEQPTDLRYMAVDSVGNQSTTQDQQYSFSIEEVRVSVSTDNGRSLPDLRVYAFTEAGAYAGFYNTTDAQGVAVFNPEDFNTGTFKFRIDYLAGQYWSQAIDPETTANVSVVIPEETVTLTISAAGASTQGVRVYLFSSTGAYLGQYQTTDENGQVSFDLPVGAVFLFRTDLYGSQYWSESVTVSDGGPVDVAVDTGGGQFVCRIQKSDTEPIAGVRAYLFNTGGTYLGQYRNSDADGQVAFAVPSGAYRVRVDYLGTQFWSDDTSVLTDTAIDLTIAHQACQVQVLTRFDSADTPQADVSVYLFSSTGAYLGQHQTTDAQGRAQFELPQTAFKVRADYLGRQYWSEAFTWQDPSIHIPLADVLLTVSGAGSPLEDVPVYVFTIGRSYLGLSDRTDADGQVLFRLPVGEYAFRADYQGSQFWSADVQLLADQTHEVGLATGGGSFALSLSTDFGQPLEGINCYVFDSGGSAYLGLSGPTDANGQVTFDLADGSYLISSDYLGHQFWSDPYQIPDVVEAQMIVDHTTVEVTFLAAAAPVVQARIYLFSAEDQYLGRYLETDGDGKAFFDLPAGVSFRFRADLSGNQYWSDVLSVPTQDSAAVTIDAGGGDLQFVIEDNNYNPLQSVPLYLFSATQSYLGQSRTSDIAGQAAFALPAGNYLLRADYLGYSFWSQPIDFQSNTVETLTIDHLPVTITVQGQYQGADQPLSDLRVYLFSETDTYLGRYLVTDSTGQAVFYLPTKVYKVRVDYQGRQYWSAGFNAQDTLVSIPMAQAQVNVTGAGLPAEGIAVYAFSQSGTYLGMTSTTNADGQTFFELPEGTYRFRADYQGNQYWSGDQPIMADQVTAVVVSVVGGTFTLDVRQDAQTPMAGLSCYVFNDAGTYLGLRGATGDTGQVQFDLAQGTFKFRIDYLGYQYWSQAVIVPDNLTETVELIHGDVVVSLTGTYLAATQPLEGQHLYLFTPARTYLGIQQTTDAGGQSVFQLPEQPYTIRADYLGQSYWSTDFQSQNVAIDIPQGAVDIHVHRNTTAEQGLRVYLFNISGTYLGRYALTDADGWAEFILPAGAYRFRVDATGEQIWTDDTPLAGDAAIQIDIDVEQ